MDDDPWDWSVDRVVQELCTTNRSWQGSRGSMPNPVELEKVLREQGITGNVLLVDIDDTVLREELGLKMISSRTFLKSAYQELRLKSLQYHQWCDKHNSETVASAYSRSINGPGYQPLGINARLHLFGSTADSNDGASSHNDMPNVGDAEHGFLNNKRAKLVQDDQINGGPAEFLDFPEDVAAPSGIEAITSELTQPIQVDINGKKRKRIAPTLITSIIDPNIDRGIPTDADNVILNDPSNVKPGQVYKDENGKKKLRPVQLQGGFDSPPVSLTAGLGEHQRRGQFSEPKNKMSSQNSSLATGYLGKIKMPVDDIFYGGVSVGEDIPAIPEESNELSIVSKGTISTGRRLYVHHITKHLLQSQPQVFKRHGKMFEAVLPYSTKFTPRHQEPSFTLYFTSADKKIHVRREHISVWPEIDPDATQAPSQDLALEGKTTSTDWDPSFLEKYRLLEGGDTILPLYGDSDEENEYDIDTWAEMEKERGEKLEKPPMSLKRGKISPEEVNEAISEGIAELVKVWQTLKLPKLRLKAWKIWAKARRDGNKRLRIQQLQHHLEHLKGRIAKMREEILGEVWSSRKQVLKQTRIMEETIFQHESHAWEIPVLECKSAPIKPSVDQQARVAAATKKMKSPHDAEGESIDSESDSSSDDDGLNDFIVSDGIGSATDKDLGLGFTGTEDNSDSSTSATSNKFPNRKLRKGQSSSGSDVSMEDAMDIELPKGSVISTDDVQSPPHHFSSPPLPARSMKLEPRLPQHPRGRATFNHQEIIELSSDGPDVPKYPDQIDLCTPTKPRASEPPSSSTKSDRIKFKLLMGSKSAKSVSDNNEIGLVLDKKNLPPKEDPAAIAKYSAKDWISIKDRERLLIRFLFREVESRERDLLLRVFKNISEDELWSRIFDTAQALAFDGDHALGASIQRRLLVRMLLMHINCKDVPALRSAGDLLSSKHLESIEKSYDKGFADFFQFCRKLPKFFLDVKSSPSSDEDDEDGEPQSAIKRRPRQFTTSDEDIFEDTPRKKHKKIQEDAIAREMRNQDRERLAEQDLRRLKLQEKLDKFDNTDVERGRIIINETKYDDQGYIYISEKIGQRIKPHQIDGVQFMWNQIVMDDKKMQGCLLAHTMGLGKTMQTITLLVAITEAARSPDEKVHSQIPPNLRVSKTLVLCPPGLIDNWMDEFLMWAPKDLLGSLRKIDSAVKEIRTRLQIIRSWHEEGGVLIMGYEMFRKIVQNNMDKYGNTPISQEQHATISDALLQGPNIIIADEAHKMKNANSGLTIAAQNFRSMSRIALTGSPLANNVEEYHTMIEWIAPNYLGPISEFRSKYVAPIEEGLYYDSSPTEIKRMNKMLRVLTNDLSPKVHRADMSVLRNDLPPKTEFVIAVPLTSLQHAAYTIYVKAMLATTNDVSQTTLWHWLAVLTLLCNHPSCFKAKLTERKQEAAASKSKKLASNPIEDLEEESVWKVGVSEDLVRQELALFDQEADITSILLSNKVKILCQILDASKRAGDKVLLFSSSLPTLDYLEQLCKHQNRKYNRLDGSTNISKRQKYTKDFNSDDKELYLISTKAGGLGLNLFGANRVVIFDFKFNPIDEEQAVGRAWRIGQVKPVFVYRLIAGGTFEEIIHNRAIFKKQLASRVVDRKSTVSWAKKKTGEYLFEPKDIEQKDLEEYKGKDPLVLDKVLHGQATSPLIRSIVQSDTFERIADDKLTAEEEKEVSQLIKDEKLKRSNPKEYHLVVEERRKAAQAKVYREEMARREAARREAARRAQLQENRNMQQAPASNGAQTAASAKGQSSNQQLAASQIVAAQQASAARHLNIPSYPQTSASASGAKHSNAPSHPQTASEARHPNAPSHPPSSASASAAKHPNAPSHPPPPPESANLSPVIDHAQNAGPVNHPNQNDPILGTSTRVQEDFVIGRHERKAIPERPSPHANMNRPTSSVPVVTPRKPHPDVTVPSSSSPKQASSLEVVSIFQSGESLLRRKKPEELKAEPSTIVAVLEKLLQQQPIHKQEYMMKAVCEDLRSSTAKVVGLLSKKIPAEAFFRDFISRRDEEPTDANKSSVQNVGTPASLSTTTSGNSQYERSKEAAKGDECQASSSTEAEVNLQPAMQQGLSLKPEIPKPADFHQYDRKKLENYMNEHGLDTSADEANWVSMCREEEEAKTAKLQSESIPASPNPKDKDVQSHEQASKYD